MKKTLYILAGFFYCSFLHAQDDHYWSQQFGAGSTLMGGAVVGGVRDNTAIFYNPGAQSYIENPNLSVDANIYKLDRLMIRNGAGAGANLNSSQLSIYPQIVSGLIDVVKWPGFNLGYAILTKNFNNVLINTRFTDRDLPPNSFPDSKFVGAFDYNNQLNEQWFGACGSYKIAEHHGIGLSVFGAYRGQTYSLTNFSRNIQYNDSSALFSTLNIDENVDYTMVSVLAKAGWAYEKGRWRLGVTITTPAIRIYGKGKIQREISLYSASEDPSDTTFSFLILDRKSSVRTVYRYPFSIAAGVEYSTPKTTIALTVEYFAGIRSYYLMNTVSEPLIYPPWLEDSLASQNYIKQYLNVRNQSKQVLNLAIGLSRYISKSFTFLFGARTDFSSFGNPEEGSVLLHSAGEWDLYHLSTGVSYRTARQTITLGFNYSFSPQKRIDPYTVINPLSASDLKSTVFAQTFGIVLGYTHYFKQ